MAAKDLLRVTALTTLPDFFDYYGKNGAIGSTYKPAVGEWGFMYRPEAEAARDAGDVVLHEENTPLDIEQAVAAA